MTLSTGPEGRAANVSALLPAGPTGTVLGEQFRPYIDRVMAPPPVESSASGQNSPLGSAASFEAVGTMGGLSDTRPAQLPVGPSLSVATPAGQAGWPAELGQRMVWLARQEVREAQIQLNPRHLGPVDVRIVYTDSQQLSVSFSAQHPAAREALDAALPRLRELFDQQGLNLADANVAQESFSGRQQMAGEGGAARHARADGRGLADSVSGHDLPPATTLGVGLIDAYA